MERRMEAGPEALWSALNNEVRRWILIAVAEQPMRGTDLARLLGVGRPTVSRSVERLRRLHLIRERQVDQQTLLEIGDRVSIERSGQWVFMTAQGRCHGELATVRFLMQADVAQRFDDYKEIRKRVDSNDD